MHTYTGHTDYVSEIFVDSGFLFSGGDDHTIRQWDTATGQLVSTYTHTDYVNSVFVDSGFLFSGSGDNTIRQWNIVLPAQTTSATPSSSLSSSTGLIVGSLFGAMVFLVGILVGFFEVLKVSHSKESAKTKFHCCPEG